MKFLLAAAIIVVSFSSFAAGDAAKGKKLYTKCISCHGKDGMGNKAQKAPMIAGQHTWYIESQIKDIRDKKRSNKNTIRMWPFVRTLKDGEVADLAAYINSLKPSIAK